jgi:tRNA G37 N-methylase TrmD
MRITVVTLFPKFHEALGVSIVRRAIGQGSLGSNWSTCAWAAAA